jgi:hypothetical protein
MDSPLTGALFLPPLIEKPFHRSAYRVMTSRVGFPGGNGGKIHPWIPGISTPEGIVLVTGIVTVATSGDLAARAMQAAAGGVSLLVVAGIPITATYVTAHFLR